MSPTVRSRAKQPRYARTRLPMQRPCWSCIDLSVHGSPLNPVVDRRLINEFTRAGQRMSTHRHYKTKAFVLQVLNAFELTAPTGGTVSWTVTRQECRTIEGPSLSVAVVQADELFGDMSSWDNLLVVADERDGAAT